MTHDALGAHVRDELGISAELFVRVRFRLHWLRLAVSLLEQPCRSWSRPSLRRRV